MSPQPMMYPQTVGAYPPRPQIPQTIPIPQTARGFYQYGGRAMSGHPMTSSPFFSRPKQR